MAAHVVSDLVDEWGTRVLTIALDEHGSGLVVQLPASEGSGELVRTTLALSLPEGANPHAPAIMFWVPLEGAAVVATGGDVDRLEAQLPDRLRDAVNELVDAIAEQHPDG